MSIVGGLDIHRIIFSSDFDHGFELRGYEEDALLMHTRRPGTDAELPPPVGETAAVPVAGQACRPPIRAAWTYETSSEVLNRSAGERRMYG